MLVIRSVARCVNSALSPGAATAGQHSPVRSNRYQTIINYDSVALLIDAFARKKEHGLGSAPCASPRCRSRARAAL